MPFNYIVVIVTVAVTFVSISFVFNYSNSKTGNIASSDTIIYTKPGISITAIYGKTFLLLAAIKRLVCTAGVGMLKDSITAQAKLLLSHDWTKKRVKRIYYIRHGESMWNAAFTKGFSIVYYVASFIQYIFFETAFFLTNESFLYDSPLSSVGISQALELSLFLSRDNVDKDLVEDIKVILGEGERKSTILVSNLRRAQSTILISLFKRIKKNNEKAMIVSELEEVCRNPDSVTLSYGFPKSTLSIMEGIVVPDKSKEYNSMLLEDDGEYISSSDFSTRFKKFNDRVFNSIQDDVVIACGHSRWIKYYLNIYISSLNPVANFKVKKLANCSVIRFDLIQSKNDQGDNCYLIDPNSIKLIYGNYVDE